MTTIGIKLIGTFLVFATFIAIYGGNTTESATHQKIAISLLGVTLVGLCFSIIFTIWSL